MRSGLASTTPAPAGSPEAARRLFRAGRPVIGTPGRGLSPRPRHHRVARLARLRYHPSVYYRADEKAALEHLAGTARGRHRRRVAASAAFSAPGSTAHRGKAPLADPAPRARPSARQRRALRHRLRLLAAGEGIETMLALKSVLPTLPMVAGALGQPSRRPRPARRRCTASMSPATTTRPA